MVLACRGRLAAVAGRPRVFAGQASAFRGPCCRAAADTGHSPWCGGGETRGSVHWLYLAVFGLHCRFDGASETAPSAHDRALAICPLCSVIGHTVPNQDELRAEPGGDRLAWIHQTKLNTETPRAKTDQAPRQACDVGAVRPSRGRGRWCSSSQGPRGMSTTRRGLSEG